MDRLRSKHNDSSKKAMEETNLTIFAKMDEQTKVVNNLSKSFDEKLKTSMEAIRAEFKQHIKEVYNAIDSNARSSMDVEW